ncbi:FAR-17a/AIG1-like protein [Lenzites betulinus]|nr:FAR-17a/AIG1-like protein [Lenzites betulinus]
MPVNAAALFLHAAGASVMTYGYLNLPDAMAEKADTTCGHFQYLTVQGLVLAWITMLLGLGYDLFAIGLVQRAKRTMIMVALPVAMVVAAIYWNLRLFMPEMLFGWDTPGTTTPVEESGSEVLSQEVVYLPVDLALHAAPAITMFIDFYFIEERYSKGASLWGSIICVGFAGSWYGWFVERCARYNGFFPYPFLSVNPHPTRVLIYCVAAFFGVTSFVALNALHP